MVEIDILYSDDFFFFYGDNNLDDEIKHDLLEQCLQPSRSYYYNREEAIGISDHENSPNSVVLQILLPYKIANGISYKNDLVEDGSYSDIDRRIALSQSTISIRRIDTGNLGINILFVPFKEIDQQRSIAFPI